MRLFRLAGFEFFLNRYFLVVLLLFALGGQLTKLFLVFSAILLHEMAHALSAQKLGFCVIQIELLPFGGVARIERLKDASPQEEFLLSSAGPAVSLMLAFICVFILRHSNFEQEIFQFFLWTNLTLAGFNLLPALPLDGGRMTRACLCKFFSYSQATSITVGLTYGVCFSLLFLLVYEWTVEGNINLTCAFGALFLFVAVRKETQNASFRTMRVLANKKADLQRRGLLEAHYYLIMEQVAVLEILPLFRPDRYLFLQVMQEDWTIKMTLGENEFFEILQAKGAQGTVKQLLRT